MRGTRAGAVFSAAGLAVALGSGAFLSPAGVGTAAGVGFGRPVAPIRGPGGAALRGPLNQIETSNWSGYAVANFETSATYTGASGTWTVPTAQAAPGYSNAYSSSWVGIGGFCTNSTCTNVDSSLIQLGTDQFWSSSGGATYSAWYELIPNGPVSISLPIAAGDIVTASLTDGPSATIAGSAVAPATKPSGGGHGKGHGGGGGSSGQNWTLQMSVTSSGGASASWNTSVTYDSSLLSGEWIEEAPTGCIGRHCEVLPLANYATATFDLGTLTTSSGSSGVSPDLSAKEQIAMIDPAGETSTPSPPDGDVDGFSTCWANGTTLSTSCSSPSS